MTALDKPRHVPTEQQVLANIDELSNWGRWGDDDERGTVNFITPAVRLRAAALVREGVTCSLAQDMKPYPPRPLGDADLGLPIQRFMMHTGQGLDEEHRLPGPFGGAKRVSAQTEWLGFGFHGPTVTHIDAFSHVSWDRTLYNGVPVAYVTSWAGAARCAVTALRDGIQTRGVLVDIPRLRGVDWLEASEAVFPEDIEAAEATFGFTVGEGDAVILRTGYQRRVREVGHIYHFHKPGWHAACMPWFHERNVAIIGTDVGCDVGPSGYEAIGVPCHIIGLVAMGLPILDECDLEGLSELAASLDRYEFLLTIAPLLVQGGTGSPVNPIATF